MGSGQGVTATGLDLLRLDGFSLLRGKSIGVVCNQASVDHQYVHILDLLHPLSKAGHIRLKAIFGPQHGLFGHTQDNMVEWEGAGAENAGVPIYSLYGDHRIPTSEMLEGIEVLVIDIQDVGSRYYTFAWTMAHCMQACESAGVAVLVLDRPNPIGGLQVEGAVLDPEFASFVGLHPLPIRHGMTACELAGYFRSAFYPRCALSTVTMQGWSRSDYIDDTDAPWAVPSPNMPTVDTAVVYPGACLLEATNISEGRGTTRPFETWGSPLVNGPELTRALNSLNLPGAHFRHLEFQPTFQKYVGRTCHGAFTHVLERRGFEPVLTYVAIMQEIIRQIGIVDSSHLPVTETFVPDGEETKLSGFAWRRPPYEYERSKLPIDILAGNAWLRSAVESLVPLAEIRERFLAECSEFEPIRRAHLLYPV